MLQKKHDLMLTQSPDGTMGSEHEKRVHAPAEPIQQQPTAPAKDALATDHRQS